MNSSRNTISTKRNPSICFVALNSFNVFSEQTSLSHIGGAERQQFEISKWLKAAGCSTSVITKDHGQPDGERYKHVRIFKAYRETAGFPLLRFFFPRWYRLIIALRRADADIYYQRGAGIETGQIAFWCHLNNRRFVFAAASEADCEPKLSFLSRRLDKWVYVWGLKSADLVFAQTRRQKALLLQHWEVNSKVVSNVMAPFVNKKRILPDHGTTDVVWIGRIARRKRVEWILELAALSPDIHFRVVGAANETNAYASRIIRLIEARPNITHHGFLSRHELIDVLRSAHAVISTTDIEGFPNVYLEAWHSGLPVVCCYDPDGVVQQFALGWVCQNVDAFHASLRLLADSTPDFLCEVSERVRSYVMEHHNPESVLPKMLEHLSRLEFD